jgi:hypothetical protein
VYNKLQSVQCNAAATKSKMQKETRPPELGGEIRFVRPEGEQSDKVLLQGWLSNLPSVDGRYLLGINQWG